ncbi:MLP-like protein 43 [Lotus japonicus]|uniref:Bet v I/Major latex protein domain-containing protein n=1 Tax=Lotus japonicus TaxID=34305 RepID=I3T371_LOTJA|nr:MLP-like protein 43 [Lotus japonicus]AFK46963.1 unknown [Lotus japonicus]AFK47767.1 unknown [Lotus japonicus]
MVLAGKLITEVGVKTPADKFYNLFTTQLHDVQKHAEKVHETKVHEGDWHGIGSVKHWTYVVDGKVITCLERVEAIDEQNKTNKYTLFGGDIDPHYKNFTLILQVIDNKDSHAVARWTIEYEKLHEDIEPPNGYMEYFNKLTRDVDNQIHKA